MAKRRRSSDSSSDDEEEDWRESSKEMGKSKPKAKPKKPIKEEEKEEGEVEDEDEDEDYEEFNDGYDENLIGDEEDQMRLANMNEKERELELFNRSEKREVLKTRFEIEKKLRMAKKKEILQSQTKMRSNERRRTIEEKRKVKNAIKGLKEQREKRKQKQQKLRAADIYSDSSSDGEDSDKKGRKRSSSSSSSSSSSNEESGDEKPRKDDDADEAGSEDDEKEKEDFVLTVEDLNAIRVSRFRTSQWCHAPFFKDTVVGCFARIFIGMRRKEQTPVYRACQIMTAMEGPKTYQLENTRTNKMIAVKHGSDTRNFKLDIVSNGPFIQSEFEELKARCERDKIELPNKDQITRKKADIDNAINYCYKDSDIEAIVREKEKYKQTPTNFAVRKTELLKKREMAEQLNNLDEVERISQEIEELESKAKELDLKRTKSISAISYINERNRMRNIIESEKAIMEAREKEKEQGDDPFRRRKCAPMLVHKFIKNPPGVTGGDKEVKKEETEERSSGKDVPDGQVSKMTPSAAKAKSEPEDSSAGGSSPKQNESTNNDLFSAHNFDIQIDFDMGPGLSMSSASSSFSASAYSPQFHSLNSSMSKTPTTNRRSLNLEEYKKKKGLI